MNRGPLLFLGLLVTMATSFWGLILAPQLQIGQQKSVVTEGIGQFYPAPRPGEARQGAEVYRSLGCVECHSQQVRGLGSDRDRHWGRRISVAQDYLYDQPVLIGALRLGPDLANVGLRLPDVQWHLVHLYNPALLVERSPMPRYPFLFEREPESARFPSPGALPMVLEEGGRRFRLVPKPEAYALVAYLRSLRSDVPLFEAPVPAAATNAVAETNAATTAPGSNAVPASASDTNAAPAPAASTNAPAPAPTSTNPTPPAASATSTNASAARP